MRYRLRVDSNISGFMEVKNNIKYFSKDMYGWSSNPIEYTDKDLCLDLKDKKGNLIFHNDICLNVNTDEIIIIYFENNKWLQINHLSYKYYEFERSLDYTKILKRFDYLYAYPEKQAIIQKVIL